MGQTSHHHPQHRSPPPPPPPPKWYGMALCHKAGMRVDEAELGAQCRTESVSFTISPTAVSTTQIGHEFGELPCSLEHNVVVSRDDSPQAQKNKGHTQGRASAQVRGGANRP